MNDTSKLNQSQEKEKIWEEKSYIEPEKNYSNSNVPEEIDTIINTKEKSILKICDDTITKKSGIYKIINKTNNKYYIGSAKNIRIRIKYGHLWALKSKKHRNRHLQRAWNKFGEDNFYIMIIEYVPIELLKIVEQRYLDIAKSEIDNVYNIQFIADRLEVTDYMRECVRASNKNRVWTKESRKKLSKVHTGYRHTDEAKQKMSDANRGKIISLEHRLAVGIATRERIKKYGSPMKGTHMSKETKQKLSKSRTGKYRGKENHAFDNTIYNFIHNKTGEIFVGTRHELKLKANLCIDSLYKLINNKIFTSKGWALIYPI